jgi:hypothetical protein
MTRKEKTMPIEPIEIKASDVVLFGSGLKLLGVTGTPLKSQSIAGKYLEQPLRVQVPKDTQFIHVSVLSQDWAFGSLDTRTPCAFASLYTEITVQHNGDGKLDKDDDGFCTILFKAALQNQATIPSSGTWQAKFMLELLFFG